MPCLARHALLWLREARRGELACLCVEKDAASKPSQTCIGHLAPPRVIYHGYLRIFSGLCHGYNTPHHHTKAHHTTPLTHRMNASYNRPPHEWLRESPPERRGNHEANPQQCTPGRRIQLHLVETKLSHSVSTLSLNLLQIVSTLSQPCLNLSQLGLNGPSVHPRIQGNLGSRTTGA